MELGCSYGKATKILCEQAGDDRVIGVDLGQEALAACRQVPSVFCLHACIVHVYDTHAHTHV